MDKFKVIVEADQQTLCQVNILFWDNNTQRKSTQHKDNNSDQRTDKYSFRIVLGRIINILYVDTAHLHTCIKQEDTGSKHQIIELREIGEEITVEVHVGMTAHRQVNNSENDQQGSGKDRTDDTTYFSHFTNPTQTFQ